MADIDDPTLTTFVNETGRPLADATVSLVYDWRRFLAEYDYLDGFPATQDEVLDGARDDHRTVLVSQDVRAFRGIINSMAALVDDPVAMDKLLRPAVNFRT